MRSDGIRVKNADPMYTLVPYVMDKRYDAQNMITLYIPVEPIQEYIQEQRKQGRSISHMAIIMAAYLRAAAEFPRLNRFIVNKRIYDRKEFCVAMVVLKPGEDNATMSKIYLDMNDDLHTVQRKVMEYVAKNKVQQGVNSMDALMRSLLRAPGLISISVGLIKFLHRHGLLPKGIIEASPFHASLAFTNLASIRTNHIYHHLSEFGTTSVFIAMGNMQDFPVRCKETNTVQIQRCLPLGVVMDERICSGIYFARAFARIKAYLANPALLEGEPQAAEED